MVLRRRNLRSSPAIICPGLEFRRLVYEGSSLTVERLLHVGGVDVLDEPVYLLFLSGQLRCCSARALQRAGSAAGKISRLVAGELAG